MNLDIQHLLDHHRFVPEVAAWQHGAFGYLSPEGTVQKRIERLNSANDRDQLPICLVAVERDTGRPVGTASLVASTLTHRHLGPWLSAVFVPEEYRGNGIASQLTLAVAAEAHRLQFEKVYLFTPTQEALYARLGWQTFERAAINGTQVCLMVKST